MTMASMSENATDPAPATAVRSASPVVGPPVRTAAVATTDFRWYPRLTRGSDGSVVAGVCVGLADHLGVRVSCSAPAGPSSSTPLQQVSMSRLL